MSVRLERRYRSPAQARAIWAAVAADNPGFVAGRVDSDRLTVEVSGESAASLRMTLDDLIACLAAAEKAAEAAGPDERSGPPGPPARKRK